MALQLVAINPNFYGLTGVYTGQPNPIFLGETTKSRLIPIRSEGKIGIGFDSRFSPAQVRIFYDKGSALIQGTRPDKYYGLVLTSEIQFDDLPILPSVHSDAIGFQDEYSNFRRSPYFNFGQPNPISPAFSLNMCSTDVLKAKNIADPYYAYNALCYTNNMNIQQAWNLNAPNGFMAQVPPPNTVNNAPLCASLYAPIGIDIDGFPYTELKAKLDHMRLNKVEPLIKFAAMTNQEYTDGKMLPKMLTALQITEADLLKVQVVGPYMVLIARDDEGFYPVLVGDRETQDIYQLDSNEMERVSYEGSSDLFEKFVDFYHSNNRFNLNRFPKRKGYYFRTKERGDSSRISTMLSGGDHVLSCHYKAYAVGYGVIDGSAGPKNIYNCFGGVEWKVSRNFSKDDLRYGPLEINLDSVKRLNHADVVRYNQELLYISGIAQRGPSMPEISNYLYAWNHSNIVGNANQYQWFYTYPPLDTSIAAL